MAKLIDGGWLQPNEDEKTVVGTITSNKVPDALANKFQDHCPEDKGYDDESEV
jgi:hypothetical protein